MLLPLQLAWLTGCKLMHVGPSRVTPLAPACTESLHHSSRRSALALLAVATAVLPPLVIAEAATAAEGIAGRNDRMVVPILGDLMGLAGPGAHAMHIRCACHAHAMHIRCAYDDAHTMHTQTQYTVAGMPVPSYRSNRHGLTHPGGSLNRAQAQLGKLAESLGQLEQLTSDLTYATQ